MATTDKAYCTEAQVEALTQLGDYTASTTPTEAEVLEFTENRAAEVYAALYQYMGAATPGPSGYSVTIDTGTDVGLAMDFATRSANAYGAAIDALEAAGAGESPGRSERIVDMAALYQRSLESLRDVAIAYIGTANRSETHVSAGDVTVPTKTAVAQQGLEFTSNTDF
jgi:hypothetical protein